MAKVTCRFYNGGRIHFVRPGGPGYNHRGFDQWQYPRTTAERDIPVLNPWTSTVHFAGRMSGGQNPTWGILVKAQMHDGPYAGDSYLVGHLNAAMVQVGQTIPAGTIIGYEGWTGHTIPAGAGGKHTHIEHLAGTSFTYKDPSGLIGIPHSPYPADYDNDYTVGADPEPQPPAGDIKVGDIVDFTGNLHYTTSRGDEFYAATPGPAKVTAINTAGKHPYHLIHTDGKSNVYGWVDAKYVVAGAAGAIGVGSVVMVKPDAKDYKGGSLMPFVYATQYTVSEIDGDRAVIVFDGIVVAAMRVADLILVR